MREDLDGRIGEIFRRLSLWRIELGEASLDAAVTDVLQTLGVAAHREAERRAQALAERLRPIATTIRVTTFAERRPPEPFDENG